ncbi:MAG: hypothetical protein MK066_00780 [Crocinitomicaceae bacterium]|nr:hypothetical protein [Crocinitomicaceae bacterium]
MSLELRSNDDLTIDIVESGIVTWDDLTRCVERFHYGRNENREDFALVWRERKGTCSSKHAFLKMMADLNGLKDIKLYLCMYKMNGLNTPGIKSVLNQYGIEYIPEAHCMLKCKDDWCDFTNIGSNERVNRLQKDLLTKFEIRPEQVISEKVQYHKKYIQNWMKKQSLNYSFDEIWSIREHCISALENK